MAPIHTSKTKPGRHQGLGASIHPNRKPSQGFREQANPSLPSCPQILEACPRYETASQCKLPLLLCYPRDTGIMLESLVGVRQKLLWLCRALGPGLTSTGSHNKP